MIPFFTMILCGGTDILRTRKNKGGISHENAGKTCSHY
jgi:hypothetical protein